MIKTIRTLSRPLAPIPAGARARIRPLAGIKAVLFDVYGTLLISAAGDISSGADVHKTRELLKAAGMVGWNLPDAATASLFVDIFHEEIGARRQRLRGQGNAHPEINIEQVWRASLAAWRQKQRRKHVFSPGAIRSLAVEYECRVNPVWPMPGLGAALARLKDAGLVLGIVSNAQFFTPLSLAAFPETGWKRGYFDARLCAWSYRCKEAKPSPRMLQSLLRRLAASFGIQPGETLVIGNDMRNDILPAGRSGCRTALFAGDQRSLRWRAEDRACRSLAPDLVLTALAQLPESVVKA